MKNHFKVRSEFYEKRHKFLIGKWEAECAFITNKARFVVENIEKKISVMNKKKKVLIEELFKAKYDSDPIKAWKAKLRVSLYPLRPGIRPPFRKSAATRAKTRPPPRTPTPPPARTSTSTRTTATSSTCPSTA